MNQSAKELILGALREPANAVSYCVSRRLSELYPDAEVVEAGSSEFDLLEFARGGYCTIQKRAGTHSQLLTQWNGAGHGTSESAGSSWYDVTWNRFRLHVVMLSWTEGFHPRSGVWIVAETRSVAESFFVAVSEWCAEARGEIVVFEGGCWQKSKELFDSVQAVTFENVILPSGLKQEIQNDFRQFFKAREEYERYGVPWKRGVLFHGPPGNGKTQTLKALINDLKQPCLYVKSFKSERYESEHEMIRRVFARARNTTPCLLVLEDLDSLIDDGNRSFFLNELDGFAANTGIVVVATTNHPERLDPAILDRPSRFDRKYPFDLPSADERLAYLTLWNRQAKPDLRLSDTGLPATVDLTDGFSYAYLKELWLVSMMRWMATRKPGTMDAVIASQVSTLKEQMAHPMPDAPPAADVNASDPRRILASLAMRKR